MAIEVNMTPVLPVASVSILEHPIVLEEEFCPECGRDTRFVIEFVFANSFLGSCTRCGDERVAVLGERYD